jgi:hypothetical protein
MRRFQVGDAVRVLAAWSAIGDTVGTVLDFIDRSHLDGADLYLVKFPDRFMRYYTEDELGPAAALGGYEIWHN